MLIVIEKKLTCNQAEENQQQENCNKDKQQNQDGIWVVNLVVQINWHQFKDLVCIVGLWHRKIIEYIGTLVN